MKKAKAIAWLYKELSTLITNGVIGEDVAARIKSHYGEVTDKNKMQLALIIFGVIGAVCMGAGIILLFAHNWDMLSRFTRTILAFLPTVISSLLIAWIVLKDKQSVGLREGVGIFNMLSVGATISLISQIYHISGDISTFLLVWMVITLPLVYLLSASLPALAYLAGITIWATMSQQEAHQAILFWPLSAMILPYYVKNVFRKPNASQWMSAAIFLCYTIAIGICLEKAIPGLWIIIYSAYFGAVYLMGARWFEKEGHSWPIPFRRFGIAGVTVLAYILSYHWPWKSIGWRYYRSGVEFVQWAAFVDYIILFAAAFTAIYFLIQMIKEKRNFEITFGLLPVVAVFGYALSGVGTESYLSGWLFTIYVLGLGIISILAGVKERKLGITNAGILITAAIMLSRFLEFDVDIITRGLAFIFTGACFLVANIALSKRMKEGER